MAYQFKECVNNLDRKESYKHKTDEQTPYSRDENNSSNERAGVEQAVMIYVEKNMNLGGSADNLV